MPFVELFDETLDINSTVNYQLSIQLSPEGLLFCILDAIRNKFILLRSTEPDDNKIFTPDIISEIISKDDFLARQYKKVSIVMPSPRFTLVPAPLFDQAKKEEYFTFNHTLNENHIVLSNKIPDPDAYIVFSVEKQLFELCGHLYPDIYPFHHTKPLLDQVSHNSKSTNGKHVHIHVEKAFFNLLIFQNSILKFSNSFSYRNTSDILYFVLNVFKSLEISQEETICFSGLTEKYDDLSSKFASYIRNIKFTGPEGNFTFSYVFNDIELHRYLNLFSAVNCE